jgi:hypothetical protein
MLKNDSIPVLTDLVEKGSEIELSDPGLDANQDPILYAEDREELPINAREFEDPLSPEASNQNRTLEQTIRRILDEHMELAWQEIEQVIQQNKK